MRTRAPRTQLIPRMAIQERKEADQWDKGLPEGDWLSYFFTFLLETQLGPHLYIGKTSSQIGNKIKFLDEH